MLHGELNAAVNLVDLVQELMSTLAGTFDDEVDVIKEPLVELDFESVLVFLSYFQDLLVNPCHEDIGIVWGWFTAHTGANVLFVQLVIKYEQVILHDQLKKLDDQVIFGFILTVLFKDVPASSNSIFLTDVCVQGRDINSSYEVSFFNDVVSIDLFFNCSKEVRTIL